MATYTMKKEKDKYVIYEGNKVLTTPRGNPVTTLYKSIAERILLDLSRYGMNFHSADSILAWHFTTIDSFAPMEHEQVEQVLISSFLNTVDWTCRDNHGSEWAQVFGKWKSRKEEIIAWLQKATIMQMTAACCIGNAYHSINLALTLAGMMEQFTGDDRAKAFADLAHLIEDNSYYGPFDDLIKDFCTFELYYGVHLEENGPILTDILTDSTADEDEELDIDNLGDHTVTIEQLIGRNYYHYTDCEKDAEQPARYLLADLELDDSGYVEEEEEEVEDYEENDGAEYQLEDLLPDDCWLKRFVDDNDPDTCYLLYLVVDEDGQITDSGCIEETSQRMGGGGMFFMIPGLELPSVKSYGFNSFPPDKVLDDLRLLFAGRALPLQFSFIQKRLPQKMIDEGGNGGSNTEYTYALQSAHRLAYTHMSVETSEDGIIESFSYSSYQSSGSAYADMFSRPVACSDRRDEAIDMLLYIYDMYTNEELEKIQ